MALLATDSEVLWLNIMNGTLGVIALICGVVILGGIVYEFTARSRRRAAAMREADGDLRAMVGTADPHSFQVPGLGLTMADGGEPESDKKRKAR